MVTKSCGSKATPQVNCGDSGDMGTCVCSDKDYCNGADSVRGSSALAVAIVAAAVAKYLY